MPDRPIPQTTVAVTRAADPRYPATPPFHPGERYPEYPFASAVAKEPNAAYGAVRDAFRLLGYDAPHFGRAEWNPLGHLITPGMTVFIKPNFVLSRHVKGGDRWAIVTHPSVLRAVADYAWIALGRRGRIILGDTPQYDCNFGELSEAGGLDQIRRFYEAQQGPAFEILDLRRYWSRWKHFPSLLETLPGDPKGPVRINLDGTSALESLPNRHLLYGAVYHREETIRHHTAGRHEYEIARSIMEADVVVSVPKLKVHKKVGVTLNVKGLVGTATNKNLIVHYRVRPPSKGGDQYPDGLLTPVEELLISTERWMYDHLLAPKIKPLEYLHRSIYWLHNHTTKRLGLKVAEHKRVMDAGNWHGNDSAWRMSVDLHRLFHFADAQGQLHHVPQRRTLTVIDGIIGGENNGPLTPDAKPAGVILASESFLAADLVATRLMGFDPLALRMYTAILADPLLRLGIDDVAAIPVATDVVEWRHPFVGTGDYLHFKPHPGWIGHVEASIPKANARAH